MSRIYVNHQLTRLIPLKEWVNIHPWPSYEGLRGLVARRKTNGFDKVIVKVGRRVLIDERAFFEWTKTRGTK